MDIIQFTEEKITVEVMLTKKKSKTIRYETRPYKLTEPRIDFLNSLVRDGKEILLAEKQINVLFALNIFNRWSHLEKGTENRLFCIDMFTYKRLVESHQNVFVEDIDDDELPYPELLTRREALEKVKDGDIYYCNSFNVNNIKVFMELLDKADIKIVSKAPKRNQVWDEEVIESLAQLGRKILE